MIIVENTEVLQILTDATAATTEPSWLVGSVSANGATFLQATSDSGATTGTTAVDMITGVASTQIRVMSISIYNRDSATRTITVRRSTSVIIFKAPIVANGCLQYEAGKGWMVYDASGVLQFTGTPGADGVDGADGALTVTEAEVDFGSVPVYEKSITVVDAGVSSTSKLVITQSGKAATDRDADENTMDFLILNATPGTGQFTLNARAAPGPVTGKYKINYQFS
jgi:hypothetical protein